MKKILSIFLTIIFLAAFLVSVITLIAAAYAAIRGNQGRAFSILGVWLVCALFLAALELGQLAGRTYFCQALGDEEVAGVPRADVGDRALSPETGDLLKKDDVH